MGSQQAVSRIVVLLIAVTVSLPGVTACAPAERTAVREPTTGPSAPAVDPASCDAAMRAALDVQERGQSLLNASFEQVMNLDAAALIVGAATYEGLSTEISQYADGCGSTAPSWNPAMTKQARVYTWMAEGMRMVATDGARVGTERILLADALQKQVNDLVIAATQEASDHAQSEVGA